MIESSIQWLFIVSYKYRSCHYTTQKLHEILHNAGYYTQSSAISIFSSIKDGIRLYDVTTTKSYKLWIFKVIRFLLQ